MATYTASASSSPITVSGLPAGSYTFTVAGSNSVGTGPASAASASVTVAAPAGGKFTPTWSDEFTGSALSWVTTSGSSQGNWVSTGNEGGDAQGNLQTGHTDYVGSSYDSPKSISDQYGIVTVANSVMTISCLRNPGGNGISNTWLGVYLVSNRWANLSWKYGYFEFRMRCPNPVRGMFPALWFYNNTTYTPASHSGAEIDLLEVFGNPTGQPQSVGVHYAGSGANGQSGASLANEDSDITQWHRYALDWQSDHIACYKDGVLQNKDPNGNVISPITGAGAAWFAAGPPLGIRIDYVMDPTFVGSNQQSVNSGTLDPPSGTRPQMQLDYVRYYPTMPTGLPTGSADPNV